MRKCVCLCVHLTFFTKVNFLESDIDIDVALDVNYKTYYKIKMK